MPKRPALFAVLVAAVVANLTLAAGCGSYGSPGSRPGLGTTWGETRSSRVQSTAFDRDHYNHPATVATLRYDDRQGLRAQAGHLTGDDRLDGVDLLGGQVSVRLLDAGGRPLDHFRQHADHYVEGHRGERYLIEIENHGPDRFEAVATVDGLDVMDGQRGSLAKRGYVLHAFGTVRIDGFRQNMDEVAAFRFGAVGDSYAALKGDDANVGVIAVALFGERGWQRSRRAREAERRREANPFPGQFAAPPPRWQFPEY
jgi:hypothetical protein